MLIVNKDKNNKLVLNNYKELDKITVSDINNAQYQTLTLLVPSI
jgi:hypothetical protein